MLRDIIRPNINLTQNNDGIILFHDTTRNKFISIDRQNFNFGIKNHNIKGTRWLQTIANIPSNILGYKIPRNGIITSVAIQTQNTCHCIFSIIKNNNENILDINLNNEVDKILENLDININIGDFLQSQLLVNNNKVDYPILSIEIAWR